MNFFDYIKTNKIIGLAPMDGVTDEPYRLNQISVCKPDVVFTEFVSAEGISHGGVKLFDQLLFKPEEKPIIGQLFGKDPESFYKAAVILLDLGFDGVDINMGCPAKKVTHNGSGAALIDKPELAKEIIKAVLEARNDWLKKKTNYKNIELKNKSIERIEFNQKYGGKSSKQLSPTVSVKTRLGTREIMTEKWIDFLCQTEIDLVTLHGRTLTQGYSGLANWDEIKKAGEICSLNKKIIWGNGDVVDNKDGFDKIKKYSVDGVLIGRAAMGQPQVFCDDSKTPVSFDSPLKKWEIMTNHARIFSSVFPDRKLEHMRSKFLSYVSGLKNAKVLREKIIHVSSVDDLVELKKEFICS